MSDAQSANSIVIEELAPDAIGRLQQLNDLFGTAFNDHERYKGAPPSDAYLTRLLRSDHFFALVALVDGRITGGLTAYELIKFERETSEIYIYDLAVAEAHRRSGVATALINELRTIAIRRGAEIIFVQADPGDDPAIALYTRLGTREDVHHFDIQLLPSDR